MRVCRYKGELKRRGFTFYAKCFMIKISYNAGTIRAQRAGKFVRHFKYTDEKKVRRMFKDLVKANRSYRGFDESRRVTREELTEMVDCARLAASSVNMQPFQYYLAWE